ncbi:flavodoxin family protein [Dethiosulfatarculus sandiegensis]|uniref:Flavodoxin n=1 Tax=Dethiosulfatarculus sandiegensis TaxID=1429043 RepID=A0A0D2JIP5_9BACT|nr:flavodoxin family protein [Dethiosulfatarculus sandiegensis]KIX15531.1 flavodoxin [Dethiosulfatarculus sandiegensis]
MRKVLVAYTSRTGNTEKVAGYIAEGLRMSGHEPVLKKISDIKDAEAMEGYDAYVFGCPTYHRDMTGGMKQFLFKAENLNLVGKVGGSFGSYTHSGDAPKYIFDTMQFVYKMDMTELGSLNILEGDIDNPDAIKSGQDYGKSIGVKLPV